LLFLLLLVITKRYFPAPKTEGININIASNQYHDISQADTNDFFAQLAKAKLDKTPFNYPVSGVVIPHHLLAGNLIINVLQKIHLTQKDKIVFITPNHFETGKKPFITSTYNWKTPFGIINPDQKLINNLNYDLNLETNETTILGEHAITGTLPYLNYFYSNVNITSIMISAFTKNQTLDVFSKQLFELTDNNTLFILSIDFSHYLNSAEAETSDEVSLKAIQQFDLERINTFDNAYVDSPKALILFLKLMQLRNTKNVEIVDHTNSGILTNNPYSENTSYFTLVFH